MRTQLSSAGDAPGLNDAVLSLRDALRQAFRVVVSMHTTDLLSRRHVEELTPPDTIRTSVRRVLRAQLEGNVREH